MKVKALKDFTFDKTQVKRGEIGTAREIENTIYDYWVNFSDKKDTGVFCDEVEIIDERTGE